MVDGRRDTQAIALLCGPESPAALASLLAGGYIEAVALAIATPPAPAAAAPTLDPRTFDQIRREVVRHLTDRLGPMADPIATRIEKAAAPGQLLAHPQLARQMLRDHRNAGAAAEFERLFMQAAPVA